MPFFFLKGFYFLFLISLDHHQFLVAKSLLLTVLPCFLLPDPSGQNKTWVEHHWCSEFSFHWGLCHGRPCARSLVGP